MCRPRGAMDKRVGLLIQRLWVRVPPGVFSIFFFFFSCLDVSVCKDLAKAKSEKPTINVKPANVKKFILVQRNA